MDLTKQPPRRPSNLSLLGIVNLARMADKARAARDETQGEYIYGMESGLDETLLTFLGISEEDFADAAERYADAQLCEWVQKVTDKTDADIQTFNNDLLGREPKAEDAKARLQARVEKFAPGSTDVKTVIQSIELEDWGEYRAVDLSQRPPRSPYMRDVVGVYAVARMAEKARAAKCDKLNGYIYNCPIDQAVLEFLGISADDFQEAAYRNVNDLELGAWVREHTERIGPELGAFNYRISRKGPEGERQMGIFKEILERVAPGRTDITTWFDLLDLDDEHDYGIVDLTRHAPRSPYDDRLLGIFGLARMIDKSRAAFSNTLGDYFSCEDSGFDLGLLGFLGLEADAFRDALKNHKTDGEMAAWLESQIDKSEDDIAEFNTRISTVGPASDAHRAFFNNTLNKLDAGRTDISSWSALMQLDDQITFARLKAGV